MAGNKAIFDAAMKRASDYTWSNNWDKAYKEYQRAVAEFPNDVNARQQMALAMFRLDMWDEALEEYLSLRKVLPTQPIILGRLAEIYTHLGQLDQAEKIQSTLADLHIQQHQYTPAREILQQIVELSPKNMSAQLKLLETLRQLGDTLSVVHQHIVLARLYAEKGDLGASLDQAEAAYNLDSSNKEAQEIVARLRQQQQASTGTRAEEGPKRQYDRRQLQEMINMAITYHEKGQLAQAIRQYESAIEAGIGQDRADVFYSLGVLYKDTGQYEQAIARLRQASRDEQYEMSSYYALGQCYKELNQPSSAARAFDRALRMIDLQAIGKNEVDELIDMYESAAQVYIADNNIARAASLYTTLHGFLQSKKLRQERLEAIRQKADELTEQSMNATLRRIGGTGEITPAPTASAAATTTATAAPATPPPGSVARPPTPSAASRGLDRRSNGTGYRSASGTLRPITDFLRPVSGGAAAPVGMPAATTPDLFRQQVAGTAPKSDPFIAVASATPMQKAPTTKEATSAVATDDSLTGENEQNDYVRYLIKQSSEMLKYNLYTSAIDACHEVIRWSPDYLPIHLRLAEIYQRSAHTTEALAKLQTLIDLYQVRGEPQEAVKAYNKLLLITPDNLPVRLKLATLLAEQHQVDEAIDQYLAIADIYFKQGQSDRALEECRKVRQLAPQNPRVRLLYGDFLLKLEHFSEAIAEFRRAYELDPNNTLALIRLSIALFLLNDETRWDSLETILQQIQRQPELGQQAAEEYKRISFQHDNIYLNYALGLIYHAMGSAREAIEQLQTAARLINQGEPSPEELAIRYAAAVIALEMSQNEIGINNLRACLPLIDLFGGTGATDKYSFVLAPSKVAVLQQLAEAYSRESNWTEALKAMTEIKKYLPYDRETYTKLAEVYFRQGQLNSALSELDELALHYQQTFQTDKMIDTLRQMTQLAPNNISIRSRLSQIYIKRGMIREGLTELDVLAEVQAKSGLLKDAVQSLQQAADIYWTMGERDKAYGIYDRIVKIAPSDIEARQQLITMHIQAGRMNDAVTEEKNIARICMQNNQTQEVIAALHQVIALAPNDTEAYYQLGSVLASIREYGQAARLYGRLAKLEPNNPRVLALQAEMQRQAAAKANGA